MKKKILFRANGSSSIGLGHLYRLFAIVEMLKQEYEFIFIVGCNSTTSVIPNEYNFVQIPKNVSIEKEPFWLGKNYNPNNYIIIADGYNFGSNYQQNIKRIGFSLVYIDDLAAEHMFADIVVNHSSGIKIKDYVGESYSKFALGTDYALLRPSFQKAALISRQVNTVDTVFICFGGSDFHNLTHKCLKAVLKIKKIKEVHVVLGAAYIHENIFEVDSKYKTKVNIHKKLSEYDMLKIMNKCHLAVIPSSTISYEVCSVKMLILGGYFVDNQIKIYKGFQEKEIIYSGGDFRLYSIEDFEKRIVEITEDSPNRHAEMLINQNMFFDGKVKERFISLIKELT